MPNTGIAAHGSRTFQKAIMCNQTVGIFTESHIQIIIGQIDIIPLTVNLNYIPCVRHFIGYYIFARYAQIIHNCRISQGITCANNCSVIKHSVSGMINLLIVRGVNKFWIKRNHTQIIMNNKSLLNIVHGIINQIDCIHKTPVKNLFSCVYIFCFDGIIRTNRTYRSVTVIAVLNRT